ncbi:17725_t:CDS:2 [Rhizophagus irregularis]|nr:17725_t:CDS:2 [Rhizophagus irregularis]
MLGRSYEKKVTTTDEWMLAHGDSEFVEISKEDGVKDGVKSGN